MQGKLLVDGGVEANVPAKEVRDMGADIVIAVDVDDTFEPAATIDSFRRIGSVSHRTLNMFLAKVDEPELKSADIVIHPDVNGINLLSMHKCDALRAIAAGEEAANNALAAIIKQINKPDMVMDKP
jgi:NTE family protein